MKISSCAGRCAEEVEEWRSCSAARSEHCLLFLCPLSCDCDQVSSGVFVLHLLWQMRRRAAAGAALATSPAGAILFGMLMRSVKPPKQRMLADALLHACSDVCTGAPPEELRWQRALLADVARRALVGCDAAAWPAAAPCACALAAALDGGALRMCRLCSFWEPPGPQTLTANALAATLDSGVLLLRPPVAPLKREALQVSWGLLG